MVEVSGSELFKLESKLDELDTLLQRLRAQLEQWRAQPNALDDDQLEGVRAHIAERP